jgi:hypothetical protein
MSPNGAKPQNIAVAVQILSKEHDDMERNLMLTGMHERERRENCAPFSPAIEVSQNEYDALCLSLNKTRLRKRLNETKSVLKAEYRKLFKPGIFKAGERALYSDSPFGYRLKWQTRLHPSQPESYENQQTSVGYVYFEKLAVPSVPLESR